MGSAAPKTTANTLNAVSLLIPSECTQPYFVSARVVAARRVTYGSGHSPREAPRFSRGAVSLQISPVDP